VVLESGVETMALASDLPAECSGLALHKPNSTDRGHDLNSGLQKALPTSTINTPSTVAHHAVHPLPGRAGHPSRRYVTTTYPPATPRKRQTPRLEACIYQYTNTSNLSTTVKVHIKTRIVTVEGPRGKLVNNLGHLSVSFSTPEKDKIFVELHHGSRKNVATLRTVRTIINNMIIGVTKGYKYKMRYVYAHFPINVNMEKNKETGLWDVDIR